MLGSSPWSAWRGGEAPSQESKGAWPTGDLGGRHPRVLLKAVQRDPFHPAANLGHRGATPRRSRGYHITHGQTWLAVGPEVLAAAQKADLLVETGNQKTVRTASPSKLFRSLLQQTVLQPPPANCSAASSNKQFCSLPQQTVLQPPPTNSSAAFQQTVLQPPPTNSSAVSPRLDNCSYSNSAASQNIF
jgi:hypothetical protein